MIYYLLSDINIFTIYISKIFIKIYIIYALLLEHAFHNFTVDHSMIKLFTLDSTIASFSQEKYVEMKKIIVSNIHQ